LGGFLHIAAQ